MGTYLAFGLNYRVSAYPNQDQTGNGNLDALIMAMEEELDFPSDNYEMVISEQEATWTLKSEVLQQQLIPLLKQVYPLLHGFGKDAEHAWWHQLFRDLEAIPPDNWISFAESHDHEYWDFCVEGYVDEWCRVRTLSSEVRINYFNIRLMMEGKFMMEEGERSFHFLRHCITRAFPEYPLARSLRIYVLG